MKILEFINMAANNKVIELVVLAIVFDTIFGVLRAVREKKFNSCAGIDCYSLVYLNQNPQFFSKLNKVWDILI